MRYYDDWIDSFQERAMFQISLFNFPKILARCVALVLAVVALSAVPNGAKAVKASPPTVTCSASQCQSCVMEEGRCVQCAKDYECLEGRKERDKIKSDYLREKAKYQQNKSRREDRIDKNNDANDKIQENLSKTADKYKEMMKQLCPDC
jgi:hypothetical protein